MLMCLNSVGERGMWWRQCGCGWGSVSVVVPTHADCVSLTARGTVLPGWGHTLHIVL